jgi:hypothetical protein
MRDLEMPTYRVTRIDQETGAETEVTDRDGLVDAMRAIAAPIGENIAEELTLALLELARGHQRKPAVGKPG